MNGAEDATAALKRRPRAGLALALALVVTALAYSSSLLGDPVWDDRSLVLGREETREFQGLGHYFSEPFWQRANRPEAFYRPLVSLSLALDHAVWQGSAAGFHATNLLLHLGVCALVFALSRRAGAGVVAAALAAALFGTLPRLSESVAWISGRSDVLAAAAGLGAIWLHSRRPATTWTRIGAALALLLALFAKENGIAALAGIAAFEAVGVLRGRSSVRTAMRRLAPCLCALLCYAILRMSVVREIGGGISFFPFATRIAMPFDVMGAIVTMILDPLHPAPRIGRVGVIEPLRVALGLAGFVGLAALLWRAISGSGSRVVGSAAVFCTVALLPVLQIIPPFSDVTAADRFLYLPAAGLAVIFAAWSAALEPRARKATAAVALVGVPIFALTLGGAIQTWRHELVLWETTLTTASPYDALPHAALGNWYAEQDEPALALEYYEAALRSQARYAELYPSSSPDPQVLGAIGITLSVLERYDEAIAHLQRRSELYPGRADSHLLLGVAQARAFEFEAAQSSLQRAEQMGAGQARELSSQTREARKIMQDLAANPRAGAESIALRARACALVGRLREAESLFARLLDEPSASAGQLAQAAHFLVLRGDPARARDALDTLALREDVDRSDVAALAHRLSLRR